jgi:hypothetical protein
MGLRQTQHEMSRTETETETKTYQHVEIAKAAFPSHSGTALFAKVGSQIPLF